MARRHWLDPLARRLLIASGQLPDDRPRPPAASRWALTAASDSDHADHVERDLLALKLRADPGLRLRHADDVRHAAALGWCLDVNRATAGDWLRLPGCTADHADQLLRFQAAGQQLCGPEDLQQLLEMAPEQLQSWLPVLEFRWYGEPPLLSAIPPLPVNQASEPLLQKRLALSPQATRRLVEERTRRPFRSLADLQQRLRLPVAQIEAWIGQLSFEPGIASPQLPSPPRPGGRR